MTPVDARQRATRFIEGWYAAFDFDRPEDARDGHSLLHFFAPDFLLHDQTRLRFLIREPVRTPAELVAWRAGTVRRLRAHRAEVADMRVHHVAEGELRVRWEARARVQAPTPGGKGVAARVSLRADGRLRLDEAGQPVQFIEYAVQAFKLGLWWSPRFRGPI